MKNKKISSIIRIEENHIEPKYEGYIVFEDLLLAGSDVIENTRTKSTHGILDSVQIMEKILINEELISIPNVTIEPIYSGEIRLRPLQN